MAKTILIVEDEQNIVDILSFNLSREGYQTLEALDGPTGLQLALEQNPDLILLDLMLPGCSGYDVCRVIRDKTDVPILMVTARTESVDKIRGLGLGADDYVVKPFSPKELMMRVAAIIKRSGGEENNRFVFEGLTVDFTARLVFIDEQRIEMSPKEYDLFFYMVRNRGVALTRERLIHDVWGYDFYGDDRTLDTHVKLLRKSLGRYSRCIITLRGVGYRFETVAEPESDADGDAN